MRARAYVNARDLKLILKSKNINTNERIETNKENQKLKIENQKIKIENLHALKHNLKEKTLPCVYAEELSIFR